MKPRLLFVTSHDESAHKEDVFLSLFLQRDFDVQLAHPSAAAQFEDSAHIILLRNIWPTEPCRAQFGAMYERWRAKGIPVYNPHVGHADMRGKHYLVDLYRAGFPVIPTVAALSDVPVLGKHAAYMVKPLYGESSAGLRKLSAEGLVQDGATGCVIQPFYKFKQEASFYFIDGVLQYTLATHSVRHRWDLRLAAPSDAEKKIAQRFVDWNALPYGIQRVDFGILPNDELLLMELEDWCPLLSLMSFDGQPRDIFLEHLAASLLKVAQI